jgi:transposase
MKSGRRYDELIQPRSNSPIESWSSRQLAYQTRLLSPGKNTESAWRFWNAGFMVPEHEYPPQWKAICPIAEKSDLNRETLRQWVRQTERDQGRRPGLTTDERQRIKDLEREVKELRRANEILKAASAFFGAELDRRHK